MSTLKFPTLFLLGVVSLSLGCSKSSSSTPSPSPTGQSAPATESKQSAVAKDQEKASEPVSAKSDEKAPVADASKTTTVTTSEPTKTETVASTTTPAAPVPPPTPAKPATIEEATKIFDLSAYQIPEGAEPFGTPRLASVHFRTPKPLGEAVAGLLKELESKGFKELPGSYKSDDSVSGTYSSNGFIIALSGYRTPDDGGKIVSDVSLIHLGNVDLTLLPQPSQGKVLASFPTTVMVVTELAPDKAREEVVGKLRELGWLPYGTAGDMAILRQNAVILNVSASSAPAQDGKTVVSYTSSLVSAELPVPENATTVQYADTNKQVFVDVPMTQQELADYYRKELGKSGWKATTENIVTIDDGDGLIFRNDAGEMLTLEMNTIENFTRATLEHLNKKEFDEIEKLAQEQFEKLKKEKMEAEKIHDVAITLPSGVEITEQKDDLIEYTVPGGKGQASTTELRDKFTAAGWKADSTVYEKNGGSVDLEKDGVEFSISYFDSEVLPAEVTIRGTKIRFVVEK